MESQKARAGKAMNLESLRNSEIHVETVEMQSLYGEGECQTVVHRVRKIALPGIVSTFIQ
jgi:hypothetical protein